MDLYSNRELSEIRDRINKEISRRGTYPWWRPLTTPKIGTDRTQAYLEEDHVRVNEKTYTINNPSDGSLEETRNKHWSTQGSNPAGDTGDPTESNSQLNLDEIKNYLVGLASIHDINLFYGRDEIVGLAFRDTDGIKEVLSSAERDVNSRPATEADKKTDPNGGYRDHQNPSYPVYVESGYRNENGKWVLPSGERDGEETHPDGTLDESLYFDDYGAPRGDGDYHPVSHGYTPLVNRPYTDQDNSRRDKKVSHYEGGISRASYGPNPRNPNPGNEYSSRQAYVGGSSTCQVACTGLCSVTCDNECSEGCTNTCFARCGNACTSTCGNVCTGCSNMCYQTCRTKCESNEGYACMKNGAMAVRYYSTGGSKGEPAQNHVESYYTSCDGCSYSCQFYPNKKTECWDSVCMNQCFVTCMNACSDSCFGGCIDNPSEHSSSYKTGRGRGCKDNCVLNCIGSCEGVCEGFCDHTCWHSCQQSCTDQCQYECSTDCGYGCTQSCNTTVTQRHSYCNETCTSACRNNCAGNCIGEGCTSICGTGNADACSANCRLRCSGTSCTAECSDACASWCTSCVNTCGFNCGFCSGGCSTGCTQACNIICNMRCQSTCDLNCTTSCTDDCGGCSSLCYSCVGMCIGVCSVHCESNCSNCANQCSWWCDDQCNQRCFSKCISYCLNTCSGSCISFLMSKTTTDLSGPYQYPTAKGYIYKKPTNRYEQRESFRLFYDIKPPSFEFQSPYYGYKVLVIFNKHGINVIAPSVVGERYDCNCSCTGHGLPDLTWERTQQILEFVFKYWYVLKHFWLIDDVLMYDECGCNCNLEQLDIIKAQDIIDIVINLHDLNSITLKRAREIFEIAMELNNTSVLTVERAEYLKYVMDSLLHLGPLGLKRANELMSAVMEHQGEDMSEIIDEMSKSDLDFTPMGISSLEQWDLWQIISGWADTPWGYEDDDILTYDRAVHLMSVMEHYLNTGELLLEEEDIGNAAKFRILQQLAEAMNGNGFGLPSIEYKKLLLMSAWGVSPNDDTDPRTTLPEATYEELFNIITNPDQVEDDNFIVSVINSLTEYGDDDFYGLKNLSIERAQEIQEYVEDYPDDWQDHLREFLGRDESLNSRDYGFEPISYEHASELFQRVTDNESLQRYYEELIEIEEEDMTQCDNSIGTPLTLERINHLMEIGPDEVEYSACPQPDLTYDEAVRLFTEKMPDGKRCIRCNHPDFDPTNIKLFNMSQDVDPDFFNEVTSPDNEKYEVMYNVIADGIDDECCGTLQTLSIDRARELFNIVMQWANCNPDGIEELIEQLSQNDTLCCDDCDEGSLSYRRSRALLGIVKHYIKLRQEEGVTDIIKDLDEQYAIIHNFMEADPEMCDCDHCKITHLPRARAVTLFKLMWKHSMDEDFLEMVDKLDAEPENCYCSDGRIIRPLTREQAEKLLAFLRENWGKEDFDQLLEEFIKPDQYIDDVIYEIEYEIKMSSLTAGAWSLDYETGEWTFNPDMAPGTVENALPNYDNKNAIIVVKLYECDGIPYTKDDVYVETPIGYDSHKVQRYEEDEDGNLHLVVYVIIYLDPMFKKEGERG